MFVWAAIAEKHLTFLRFIPEVKGKKTTTDNLSSLQAVPPFRIPERKKKKKKYRCLLTDRDLTHCTFKGLYRPVAFRQLRKTQLKTPCAGCKPLLFERQVAKYIHVKSYLFDSLFLSRSRRAFQEKGGGRELKLRHSWFQACFGCCQSPAGSLASLSAVAF